MHLFKKKDCRLDEVNNLFICCNTVASLLQALDKQQESLLHFREAVKLAPWNFEAQKGTYI